MMQSRLLLSLLSRSFCDERVKFYKIDTRSNLAMLPSSNVTSTIMMDLEKIKTAV